MIERSNRHPTPDYILSRPDKNIFRWFGRSTSRNVFRTFNLDWDAVSAVVKTDKLPIGDLGASFSTFPIECDLRGIQVIPVDLHHEVDRPRYAPVVSKKMYSLEVFDDTVTPMVGGKKGVDKLVTILKEGWRYRGKIKKSIDNILKRYLIADLSHIPLTDRSLSISIVSNVVPKYSFSVEDFLERQLPEILRVTNQSAYIWPLAVYKENEVKDKQPRNYQRILSIPDDEKILEKVRQIASDLGFKFKLESNYTKDDPMYGVFTRKQTDL